MNGTTKPALVVAGWTAGNAVLAAILPAFHERPFAVTMYAVATAIPALVALALLRVPARNPRPEEEFTLGGGSQWVLPNALGLILIGLGAVFGIWFVIIGAVLVVVSSFQLVRESRPRPTADSEAVDGRS